MLCEISDNSCRPEGIVRPLSPPHGHGPVLPQSWPRSTSPLRTKIVPMWLTKFGIVCVNFATVWCTTSNGLRGPLPLPQAQFHQFTAATGHWVSKKVALWLTKLEMVWVNIRHCVTHSKQWPAWPSCASTGPVPSVRRHWALGVKKGGPVAH